MKVKNVFILILFLVSLVFSNGVLIVDPTIGEYLTLKSSVVDVRVENQVALIKTTQTYKNTYGDSTQMTYAFPMANEANAIELRWFINNEWNTAMIQVSDSVDSPGPSETDNLSLKAYVGETPLYYKIEDLIQNDSTIVVELTYVQFLDYRFGNVQFVYPNDYSLLQSDPLELQKFIFDLRSERTIEDIELLSHLNSTMSNDGNDAVVNFEAFEESANQDYNLEYSLSLSELGLFSLSTFLQDGDVPDSLGRGFFVFVAEPDPSDNTDVIEKVFTLIVDRSGSMGGTKMTQAINAADFIVQNLNEGDKFNVVDFSTEVTCLSPTHLDVNATNVDTALEYIHAFAAGGGTNISGAFETAIPQFGAASDNTANIIVFFTDGQATSGITDTDGILNIVQTLQIQNENEVMLFTFGIGLNVNEQLLTLLASENNGAVDFLGDDELEQKITEFYMLIRNPVLLNTQVTFTPSNIYEVYPNPLPNLFKGQQMIVVGRYSEPAQINVNFSGEAFGEPISYDYSPVLADSAVIKYRFLPKIWAKSKIDDLMDLYYSYYSTSQEALEIKQQVIDISLAYSVLSPFTEFSGNEDDDDGGYTGIEELNNSEDLLPASFTLLGNYPNPFNPTTTIKFSVNENISRTVEIKMYNSSGQFVRMLTIDINGQGIYSIIWDGKNENGFILPTDVYYYQIDFGVQKLTGKMILLK